MHGMLSCSIWPSCTGLKALGLWSAPGVGGDEVAEDDQGADRRATGELGAIPAPTGCPHFYSGRLCAARQGHGAVKDAKFGGCGASAGSAACGSRWAAGSPRVQVTTRYGWGLSAQGAPPELGAQQCRQDHKASRDVEAAVEEQRPAAGKLLMQGPIPPLNQQVVGGLAATGAGLQGNKGIVHGFCTCPQDA